VQSAVATYWNQVYDNLRFILRISSLYSSDLAISDACCYMTVFATCNC